MNLRVSCIILVLATMSVGTTAEATPACEDKHEANYEDPPTHFTLPVSQEVVCGVRSPDARALKIFAITDPPATGERSGVERGFVVEHEGGPLTLWRPQHFQEDPRPGRHVARVDEVYLEQLEAPTTSAQPAGCLVLPDAAVGKRYVIVLEPRYNQSYHPVLARVRFDAEASDRPEAPAVEKVVVEPLRHACSDHGLFVARFGEAEPDGRFYVWSVHDEQGRLVQTGRGGAPHALAFPDRESDGYTLPRRELMGETRRPYEVGQTYEMRVRALDDHGRHSPASTAQFTFDATGDGMSYGCLAVTIVLLLGAAGGALIVLSWLFNGLIRLGRFAKDGE